MARKPKDQPAPARQRTEPTKSPLEGGAYDEDGDRVERLEDAPSPERKE